LLFSVACYALLPCLASDNITAIAFQLMPAQFTLSELQKIYEIDPGEPIEKRNFRTRVLALDNMEKTGEDKHNDKQRPARLIQYVTRRKSIYSNNFIYAPL